MCVCRKTSGHEKNAEVKIVHRIPPLFTPLCHYQWLREASCVLAFSFLSLSLCLILFINIYVALLHTLSSQLHLSTPEERKQVVRNKTESAAPR